ncbi:hypothetical protein CAPTEDRAFT_229133 [Capitella teleta]|uniref:Tyrosine specific protein phosphatases domain-containing protein n=1 Tax=Capitella teleta TaxID=283909 RepID=R7VFV8_CAPTE|nr:hypothetical protein CAPTEDRAFT_229133 [Capitella teleta]|eukprot:ELU17718.1 hypothetical protein CAPTEDRAFT_229133 [Capitella teleta]
MQKQGSSLSFQKEQLNWEEEDAQAIAGIKPSAKYGPVSEALRHAIPEKQTCKSFCGGRKCKYCNVNQVGKWNEKQCEIKGIFSNWVTDNILAMARPVTVNIEEFNIIDQFKENGIKSIINLQLSGEHSTCGNGNEEGGFSYKPQQFMDEGIFFYNFGWEDYGVGTLGSILDVVKVMQFSVSEGKTAVHCHAGLGRTGVTIACYLVFTNAMDPYDAIHYVRSKRRGAIQTQSQIECIHQFSTYLRPLRQVFHIESEEGSHDFTLSQFLTRQKHMLHGYEARNLKFIPKIICVCCERLLQLAGRSAGYTAAKDSNCPVLRSTSSSSLVRSSTLHSINSNLSENNFSTKRSVSLESFSAITPKSSRKLTKDVEKLSVSSSESKDASSKVEVVAMAMAETEYSSQVLQAVHQYMTQLNCDTHAFDVLAEEKDPTVLAALIWEWLDHLKEPMLNSQDLPNVLEYASEPLGGLELLEKGARFTILYLSEVVALLEPLPESIELELVQRLLSTLSHQNMVVEFDPLTSPDLEDISRTKNSTGFMRENVANRLIYFFSHLVHINCGIIHKAN